MSGGWSGSNPEHATMMTKPVEWLFAFIVFSWGLRLLGAPFLSTNPSYATLADVADQNTWAIICLALGGARMLVLFINGAWRKSPHARTVLSVLTLVFWVFVCFGFIRSGAQATGLTVYPWAALFEAWVAWRVVGEAARYDRGAAAWKSLARSRPPASS